MRHHDAALRRIALTLFLTAMLATTAARLYYASTPYTYAHGAVSADVAVAARNFARLGVFELGGVPVNNNPPIGTHDAYTHWPPLLPIILGWTFRVFGESAPAAHGLMLLIQALTGLLVFALARDWLGSAGGALAGFFWLTLPVVVHFGNLVAQQSLAVLFLVCAVWAFRRSDWGALAVLLAVWSSWEAVLLIPGLWLVALKLPDSRRRVFLYTLAAVTGFGSVVGLYAWHNPELFADTLQTARYRMGLVDAYSNQVLKHSAERLLSAGETVNRLLWNHFRMLGVFGGAAAVSLLSARPKGCGVVLGGLGGPWLVWSVLMSNHVAVHPFELLLAAPLAAVALAWVALALSGKKKALLVPLVAAIAVQPWILGSGYIADVTPAQLMGFAEGIHRATPPDSVVFSPLASAVPVYFSERHVIRNIGGEAVLQAALPQVRRDHPGARLYLAVPPRLKEYFAPRGVVLENQYVVVMELQ